MLSQSIGPEGSKMAIRSGSSSSGVGTAWQWSLHRPRPQTASMRSIRPVDLEELPIVVDAGVLRQQRRTQRPYVARQARRPLRVFELGLPGHVDLAIDAHAAVGEIGCPDRQELVVDDHELGVNEGRRTGCRVRRLRAHQQAELVAEMAGHIGDEAPDRTLAIAEHEVFLGRVGAVRHYEDDLQLLARGVREAIVDAPRPAPWT